MRLAPELGYSSVMYDGSHHDFDTNRELTRQAVEWGRANGIWIEAELGEVGGKNGAHAPGVRTDPAQAAQFVHDIGVDASRWRWPSAPRTRWSRRPRIRDLSGESLPLSLYG